MLVPAAQAPTQCPSLRAGCPTLRGQQATRWLLPAVPELARCLPLQYDPQATGSIDYQQLMKQLLHSDYYALYLGTVDNTQNTLEATAVANLGSSLRNRIRPQAERLQKVGTFSAKPWVHAVCCWSAASTAQDLLVPRNRFRANCEGDEACGA